MIPFIGNRDNLPVHPEYLEDLEVKPTGFRIYKADPDPYEADEDQLQWQLDGYAIVDGQFAFSGALDSFRTWQDAVEALPDWIDSWND